MPTMLEIWLNMKSVLRSARQIINTELEPMQLMSAEGDILFHMIYDNTSLSQEKLAECLDIGKAAISRTVASLVDKGYIKRERNPDDARMCALTLTQKALDIRIKIEKIYNDVYDIVKQNIAEDELQSLSKLLQQAASNLQIKENKND